MVIRSGVFDCTGKSDFDSGFAKKRLNLFHIDVAGKNIFPGSDCRRGPDPLPDIQTDRHDTVVGMRLVRAGNVASGKQKRINSDRYTGTVGDRIDALGMEVFLSAVLVESGPLETVNVEIEIIPCGNPVIKTRASRISSAVTV